MLYKIPSMLGCTFIITSASQNARFNMLACCRGSLSCAHYVLLIPDLMVWVCLILDTGGALLIVFQPFMVSQAASESVDFKLSPTPPLLASPPHTHTHAEHLSTHKPDRASLLHTPKPDMQFISWKTCGRAKGWRTFYLVSLLSMLYLGSFHPPADSRVYTPPPGRNLRLWLPKSRDLMGKSGRHVRQESFANVHRFVAETWSWNGCICTSRIYSPHCTRRMRGHSGEVRHRSSLRGCVTVR